MIKYACGGSGNCHNCYLDECKIVVCDECEQTIVDDCYYEIGDQHFCESCVNDKFRVML